MSLSALARMLGIKTDLAEDALHSERAARAVLTRRNLFAAGGALAAGSVFSFGVPPLGWEAWYAYIDANRAYWDQVFRLQTIDIKRALVSMIRERDHLQQTTRPPVQLSTPPIRRGKTRIRNPRRCDSRSKIGTISGGPLLRLGVSVRNRFEWWV
jgi:hypothetical protein